MTDRISIICPTYNRRSFLPYLIYQFSYQTYTKELLKMYILDDSESSNIDIFNTINDLNLRSRIIYIHDKNKKTIGAKRNILNNIVKNIGTDFIVCFDDDDYYSPTHISNNISHLKISNKLIGGIPKILIYYPYLDKICKFGMEYNYITMKYCYKNAPNGTLIYNVKYLEHSSYNDLDICGEEKYFLKNFSINLCIFDMNSYILISHNSNTIEKSQFIKRGQIIDSNLNHYINDSFLLNFYINLK